MANWTLNQVLRAVGALAANGSDTPAAVDAATVAKADETMFQVTAAWTARPTRGGIDIQIRGSVDGTAFETRPSIKAVLFPDESGYATTAALLISSRFPHSKITVVNGTEQIANVGIKYALKQISQAV